LNTQSSASLGSSSLLAHGAFATIDSSVELESQGSEMSEDNLLTLEDFERITTARLHALAACA